MNTTVRLAILLVCSAAARAQGPELLGIGHAVAHEAPAAAPDPEISGLIALARRTRSDATAWAPGKPLSGAKNAHSTNTHEDMKSALEHGYNFLEGDVREEINAPHALEMRHDTSHESGNNLTLAQWLAVGLASGRGLKLDVKEPQHMARVLDAVAASGVPAWRVMFNLGSGAMDDWGARIRGRFATSWLAINPPSGDGALAGEQVATMIGQARKFGAPATFVVRLEHLTAPALDALRVVGPVSIWNSPNEGRKVKDAKKLAASLRARGVDGVIDIRESASLLEKTGKGIERGYNEVRTFLGL